MFSSSGMRTARDWAPTSTAMGLFRLLEGYFFSLEAGLAVGAFFALCSSVFLLRAGFHPTGLSKVWDVDVHHTPGLTPAEGSAPHESSSCISIPNWALGLVVCGTDSLGSLGQFQENENRSQNSLKKDIK